MAKTYKKQMKRSVKTNSLLLVSAFAIMFFSFMVSAAVSLAVPATNAVVGDTVTYNITLTNADTGQNFTCDVYVGSVSTANTTWTLVSTIGNNTAGNDTATEGTFLANIIEDSNDYQFNASCYNDTETFGDSVNTGITVDGGEPTAATSLSPTTETTGVVSFSGVVVDRETTGCTLYFSGTNPGSPSYTMTYSGSNCSYSFTSAIPEQSYIWYIRASDGSNTTDSATKTTLIDIPSGTTKVKVYLEEGKVEKKGSTLSVVGDGEMLGVKWGWWVAVILVIVGIAIYIKNK